MIILVLYIHPKKNDRIIFLNITNIIKGITYKLYLIIQKGIQLF